MSHISERRRTERAPERGSPALVSAAVAFFAGATLGAGFLLLDWFGLTTLMAATQQPIMTMALFVLGFATLLSPVGLATFGVFEPPEDEPGFPPVGVRPIRIYPPPLSPRPGGIRPASPHPSSRAPRRIIHSARHHQNIAQAAPAAQPASTSLGQWTPR